MKRSQARSLNSVAAWVSCHSEANTVSLRAQSDKSGRGESSERSPSLTLRVSVLADIFEVSLANAAAF